MVNRGETETKGLPNPIIDRLRDAYLIRADIRGGETWYELTHDRLVEPIVEANLRWRADYYNPVAVAYQSWLEAGRNSDKLLDGSRLQEAQTFANSHPREVTDAEEAFLADSRRQEDAVRQRRRQAAQRRRVTIIVAVVVAVMMGLLAFWGWYQATEATRNAAAA